MDWITIIGGFLQVFLAKCYAQQETGENPKEFLRRHYDASTGKIDPSIVHQSMPATRRAEAKARRDLSHAERKLTPKLTNAELYDLAEKKLIEGMNADESTLIGVFSSAAALRDED